MKSDKLLLINFNQKINDQITYILDHLNIHHISSKLNEFNQLNPSTVFFYASQTEENFSDKLESIRHSYPNCPVVVVLENDSFDILLSAFYANVEHVIITPIEQVDIEKAMAKVNLMSEKDVNDLPVKQLLKLFSSPTKISDDETLFKYLKEYFFQFEQTLSLGLYVQNRELELVAGKNATSLEKLEEMIEALKNVSDCVGKYFIKKLNGNNLILLPLFRDELSSSWAILELKNNDYESIVNDYLINFILGIFHYRRNKEKALSLRELSNTDEVTGLYNQRKLTQDLKVLINKYKKSNRPFSLLFIDIDHFKFVNDNFGHLVGSQILTELGSVMKRLLRQTDHVYRYGGDEFVVLLSEIDQSKVHDIALRLLEKVKAHEFYISENNTHRLSISIGICEYPTDAKTSKEVIAFADKMMYQSKSSGRGKVFHLTEIIQDNLIEQL